MKSAALVLPLVVLCGSLAGAQHEPRWTIPRNAPLLTRWAEEINPNNVLPEYPRPMMVRTDWMNLNGRWQFADATAGEKVPAGRDLPGRILVPFPIESALSGVMKHADRLWYRRTFTLPGPWKGKRLLLHFGAVDWEATVYINGKIVGMHQGGYDPFSFDITDALKKDGDQELILNVFDPSDAGEQPRGKQVREPKGIWYTPTTGIWQTVWLEPVPDIYIRDLHVVPDIDLERVFCTVSSSEGGSVRITVFDGEQTVGSSVGRSGTEFSVHLDQVKLWSPTTPFLYDLRVELLKNGSVVDVVTSYVGMRKISLGRDRNGIQRLMLNGEFVFQVGPLDQGFWPDGLYTAPTDEALRYDIEMTKKLGFTMARKHVKVEPQRWYSWADRLGLLVWQDMPSGNNRSSESRQQFELELERMIRAHRNHPSIIMWVIFNEGWGQYDTERLTPWVKSLDHTRLVNNASGWTDKNVGDVMDIHNYPTPKSPPAETDRAIVLGEYGGLGLAIPGHTWKEEHWGYQGMKDVEQLTLKYERFMKSVYDLKDNPGLSAAVYTQITDVEIECNGLLTYDRNVVKPDMLRIGAANRGDFSLMPPLPIIHSVVPTSEQEAQIWRYTLEPPQERWEKPDFNDSSWRKGEAGFGKKETPGAIVRTEWATNTIWLRREFTLDLVPGQELFLRMHHDEDAKVYINGVLAVSVDRWTTEYEQVEISAEARAALKPGRNLLAVSCAQTSGGQYIDVGIVFEGRK